MRTLIVFLLAVVLGGVLGIYASRTQPTSSIIDEVLTPLASGTAGPAVPLPEGAENYGQAVLTDLNIRPCFDEDIRFSGDTPRLSRDRAVKTPPAAGEWVFPDLADYPGLVKLEKWNSELGTQREHCGAARIAEHWFMTASHCIGNDRVLGAAPNDIVLLTPSVDSDGEGVVPVPATGALCHYDWGTDRHRYPNDIALVYVADPSAFADVAIVAFESADMELRRSDLTGLYISGWGSNGNSRFLQGGAVAPFQVGASVIVTQRIGTTGPDVGDSGSPLYSRIDQTPTVVGVLAAVQPGQSESDRNAIFVRVKGVRDWLDTTMALCEQDGRFVCGLTPAASVAVP
ncbi:MAG: trypsin-like serine protease [Pseudomonadota bacterium]